MLAGLYNEDRGSGPPRPVQNELYSRQDRVQYASYQLRIIRFVAHVRVTIKRRKRQRNTDEILLLFAKVDIMEVPARKEEC